MPKVKSSKCTIVGKMVEEFGSDTLSGDGEILKCIPCNRELNYNRKSNIIAHLATAKHRNNVRDGSNDQNNTGEGNEDKKQFNLDLCEALVNANIPIWKIENKKFKSFLKKYTRYEVPDESTIRKNYVDVHFKNTMRAIQTNVGNSKIWVSIDETTDTTGRQIANMIIGILEVGKESKMYLLNSQQLEKTNSTTIAQFFASSLALLWPDGIMYDNVLLLVTDAASYMKKASSSLQILYPNMIHLTCLCHGLHRIAEEIRMNFPDVDKLISNVKKIFLKAPSRIDMFKNTAPDLALPPQPVLTRWGTWLNAALYYANNFDTIKTIVFSLDPEDASSIEMAQHLLDDHSLRNNLTYISANFSALPDSIKKLEERNSKLVDAVGVFQGALQSMSVAYGSKGLSIKKKCERIELNNPGLETIKKIREILIGEHEVQLGENIARNAHFYQYAPVTSVEVERSFSKLKSILSDKRLNLTSANMKKFLVISCNDC